MITLNDFIKLREKDWGRLQTLLDQHTRRRRLSAVEVRELGTLYRAAVSDLAQARRDYAQSGAAGQRVLTYLNQLLTRAHSTIYQDDVADYGRWRRYFTHDIPLAFRALFPFIAAAFALFMLPAIAGYALAASDPTIAAPLGLEAQREQLADQSTWLDIPVNQRPLFSSFIMANNIRVALLAFGGGVAFGLFTVYILVMNGLTIGAVLGLAAHYGLGGELVDFVFGHGVVELSVIFIAGGGGLALGWSLLQPGVYTRRDSLWRMAQRSAALAVIAVPLLMVAGLIEGFISPSQLPFVIKMSVGLGSGALMLAYLMLAGRTKQTG